MSFNRIMLFSFIVGVSLMAYMYFNLMPNNTTKEKSITIEENVTININNEETTEITTETEIYETGYVTSNVNLRKEKTIQSDIISLITFNQQINYIKTNQEWTKVQYNNSIGYIKSEYISPTKINYIDKYVPNNKGFKSFMPYQAITSKSSPQYKLQRSYAYTGNYGIRQANGRYCVAVGSYYASEIGTYIDLYLQNGEIIPCILSDQKADIHTDSKHIKTKDNGCVSEFIVDMDNLDSKAKKHGNISFVNEKWNSPVEKIRIYNKKI